MVDREILISMLKQCTSDTPYACVECPYVSFKSLIKPNKCINKCIVMFLKDCFEYLENGGKDRKPSWSNIDLHIRDRETGIIHKIGDDQHDSLWVDDTGTVHYYNLQNGDGCGANSVLESEDTNSYEFCPSSNGKIDRDYFEQHKDDYKEYFKKWKDING